MGEHSAHRLSIGNDNDERAFDIWAQRLWQTINGRHAEAQRQLIVTQDQEIERWLAHHSGFALLDEDGRLAESAEGRAWLRLELRHELEARALALEQQEEHLVVLALVEKYAHLGQIPMQLGPPSPALQAWEHNTIESLRSRQQEERARLTDRQRAEQQQATHFWDEDRRLVEQHSAALAQRLTRGGLVYTLRGHRQTDQQTLAQVQGALGALTERETRERDWLTQRQRSESDELAQHHKAERLATHMHVLEALITGRLPTPQPAWDHGLDRGQRLDPERDR